MKSLKIVLAVLIVFSLVSCGKELSFDSSTAAGGSDLLGKWRFIEMSVKGTSDVTLTEGADSERSVTTNDYTTTDNSGTLTINSKQFITTDLEYTVSTISSADLYSNGVFNGTVDMPFDFIVPKTSATSDYKLIGTDSIYFSSGAISGLPGTTSTMGTGAKYRIQKDTLYVITNINLVETSPYPGYPTITMTKKSIAQSINVFKKL